MKIPDPKLKHFVLAAMWLVAILCFAAACEKGNDIPSDAPPRTGYCCSR